VPTARHKQSQHAMEPCMQVIANKCQHADNSGASPPTRLPVEAHRRHEGFEPLDLLHLLRRHLRAASASHTHTQPPPPRPYRYIRFTHTHTLPPPPRPYRYIVKNPAAQQHVTISAGTAPHLQRVLLPHVGHRLLRLLHRRLVLRRRHLRPPPPTLHRASLRTLQDGRVRSVDERSKRSSIETSRGNDHYTHKGRRSNRRRFLSSSSSVSLEGRAVGG
jgi:hypothetical protein